MGPGEKLATQPALPLEERKFLLEEMTTIHDRQARDRELNLREREVAAKELELKRAHWLNGTSAAIFAAAIALLGNLYVEYSNNTTSQQLEREKEASDRALKHDQQQADLLLQAVKTGDWQSACSNLVNLVNAKILDDPHGNFKSCQTEPRNLIPVLPVGSQPYIPQVASPRITITPTNGSYLFEAQLTIPKPAVQPFPFTLITAYAYKTDDAGVRSDDLSLQPMRGQWNPGDSVRISESLPKTYLSGSKQVHLNFCMGSEQACLPTGFLVPRNFQ